MKAVGMFAQGIASYDAGKYTRSAMQTNGQNAQNAGVMERDRVREAARISMGRQLVEQGGSGFAVGTGSGLDALHASAIARELDLSLSRAKASSAAAGFKQQGDLAYAQGKSAMAGGIISGAAEIASEVAGAMGGMPGGGGSGSSNMSGSAATPSSSYTVMGSSGLGDSFTVGSL
jgi:hypothetical protein